MSTQVKDLVLLETSQKVSYNLTKTNKPSSNVYQREKLPLCSMVDNISSQHVKSHHF